MLSLRNASLSIRISSERLIYRNDSQAFLKDEALIIGGHSVVFDEGQTTFISEPFNPLEISDATG